MTHPFNDFYRGKTVLVTGDTGFKGSWLVTWLKHLGARVIGYALDPPTTPSNFAASRLDRQITHITADVRDHALLLKTCRDHRPEVVFHLAAQSLVRRSYDQARYTFDVNVMGTVNALEAARETGSVKAAVIITSDKCYLNVGWEWPYRETDQLGGYDPYSASKACAELAISVYQDSRFQLAANPTSDLAIASTRAGNVIGGGDWACDRIVPDTIRAIASNRDVVIRNPSATRPWQHVLEPLSAYLWLGVLLTRDRGYCSSWNIGPAETQVLTVEQMVRSILTKWQASSKLVVEKDNSAREAQLLRLDCSKANQHLKWRATWLTDKALDGIVDWYKQYYSGGGDRDMYSFTVQQIEQYTRDAQSQDIAWATANAANVEPGQ
jgi:CDP-glucose 4,6-dehydratase